MKIKALIKECLAEIIKEDLEVPSQDGTADGASEDEKEKAKKATQDGQSVTFVKPGEIEEGAIETDEAHEKVIELVQKLAEANDDIADLEDFANENGDAKMKKLTRDLADHIIKANETIAELKKMKDSVLAEEAEDANTFGDKVMKYLKKHMKKEGGAESMKKKYMQYIHKAFKKGKSAKEVADRIKDHRFEL